MRNDVAKKKPIISLPVIVEGRYDKAKLLSIFSATVIETGGFAVFNSKEKQALIRKIASSGVIVLTDSDGGGRQIRSFLSGVIPPDKIYQLYIPKIQGKERRKAKPSKENLLGVEGMQADLLMKIFDRFILREGTDGVVSAGAEVTPAELYFLGLSGGECSVALRDELCSDLGLPSGMSAKALLCALNVAFSREEFEIAVKKMSKNDSNV